MHYASQIMALYFHPCRCCKTSRNLKYNSLSIIENIIAVLKVQKIKALAFEHNAMIDLPSLNYIL